MGFKYIGVLGVLLVLEGTGFAAKVGDPVAAHAAALPWKKSYVETGFGKAETPDLIVTVRYQKEGVVKDQDVFTVKLRPLPDNPDIVMGGASGTGSKIRCGPNSSCSGSTRLGQVEEKGFQMKLQLSWQKGGRLEGKVDETFDCRWVAHQEFEKDGLTLTVDVEVPDAVKNPG